MRKGFILIPLLWALTVLFSSSGAANRSDCEFWHSCPSKEGTYVCGDFGNCAKCPDNQYCIDGKRRKQEEITNPFAEGGGFEEPRLDIEEKKTLCEDGEGKICFEIGDQYRIEENNHRVAVRYYLKACKLNFMTACSHAAILYQHSARPNSPQWTQAAKLYRKVCNAKDSGACLNLGNLLFKEKKKRLAMQYFKKSCDYGNTTGCQHHARLNGQKVHDPKIVQFCKKLYPESFVLLKDCVESEEKAKKELGL